MYTQKVYCCVEMFALLAAVAATEAAPEMDPRLIEMSGELDSIESAISETVGLIESSVSAMTPDQAHEQCKRLGALNERADNVIRLLQEDVPRNVTLIPLVLVETTRGSQGRPELPLLHKFSGFVVAGRRPTLRFKPLLPLSRGATGLYFQPSQNLTCEVRDLKFVFTLDSKAVFRKSHRLARGSSWEIVALDLPVWFDGLAVMVAASLGDAKRMCQGRFNVFSTREWTFSVSQFQRHPQRSPARPPQGKPGLRERTESFDRLAVVAHACGVPGRRGLPVPRTRGSPRTHTRRFDSLAVSRGCGHAQERAPRAPCALVSVFGHCSDSRAAWARPPCSAVGIRVRKERPHDHGHAVARPPAARGPPDVRAR